MKVEVILDAMQEDKVVIHATSLTPEVQKIYSYLKSLESAQATIIGYHEDLEYYLNTQQILFFETLDETLYAHKNKQHYLIKQRLYELEKKLPGQFMRISKTTILNLKHLYAIEKGFGGPRMIQFLHTDKTVYVSRKYYPLLNEKLKERL